MRIGVMGPQGSGKSTQSKLLAEKFNLCVIDTGGLIRERAKLNDSVTAQIKKSLDKGILVDNQIPADLLRARLGQPDCTGGVVIDGYPRSLDQLAVFDPEYQAMVYLNITDEVAVSRLTKRGREDDTPDQIKQRLAIFHQKTQAVLEHYQSLGILIKVDGSQDPQTIFTTILEKLNV